MLTYILLLARAFLADRVFINQLSCHLHYHYQLIRISVYYLSRCSYDLPAGRSQKWPAIVLEVARSQTRRSLTEAIKFWLYETGSGVQVAISISVSARKILVERWVRGRNGPSADQCMEIVRDPRPNFPRVNGSFSIDVSDVMLRARMAGETDFVMTTATMNELANYAWQ
jgi:hypothetical protein